LNYMKIITALIFVFVSCQVYGSPVTWVKSYDEAVKESKIQRKCLLVLTYIEKDEKYKELVDVIYKDADLTRFANDFVYVQVSDKDKPGFSGYPVIQFKAPSGKEFLMLRLSGQFKKNNISGNMQTALWSSTKVINKKFEPFIIAAKTIKKGNIVRIRYKVLERGFCSIKVYDSGRVLVKKIFSGVKKPDSYFAEWDQKNNVGQDVPVGDYVVVFELGSYKDILEMNIQ